MDAAETEVVAGVSHADVAACCRVLDALGNHMQLVASSPNFKALRKSLIPFVQAESARRFGGMSKEDNEMRRHAAQRSNREQQQAKARDRKFIENTLLRAGRRAKLDALKEATDDDRLMLLVPDGLGADAAEHMTRALPAPEGSEAQLEGEETFGHGEISIRREGAESLNHVSPPPPLKNPRSCYICKVRFTQLHFFYDQLCPSCAELNYQKRMQTADLTGKIGEVLV